MSIYIVRRLYDCRLHIFLKCDTINVYYFFNQASIKKLASELNSLYLPFIICNVNKKIQAIILNKKL